jgi:hypothetical protein
MKDIFKIKGTMRGAQKGGPNFSSLNSFNAILDFRGPAGNEWETSSTLFPGMPTPRSHPCGS